MPQWLLFAVIALVWVVGMIVIVVFMMGASRVRRKQREIEESGAKIPVAAKDS
ncbi:MAG: hypothetical protein ABI563_13305 [Specibacter sp.]